MSSRTRSNSSSTGFGNDIPTILCLFDISVNYNNLDIQVNYLVYLSECVPINMPAHKKLLPRPCPQCKQINGGCQWVIFNPFFYKERIGYSRRQPYQILRISHYSSEYYNKASPEHKNNRTKIWHNFQTPYTIKQIKIGSRNVWVDQIFNEPECCDKKSITLPMSGEMFEEIKRNGWHIKFKGGHWVERTPRFNRYRYGRKKRVRIDLIDKNDLF